ncbi:hypothetical protein FA13DRAFT_1800603 [Coprinellus micaceus]|uniref:Uncharacterized protein n=1 Tax=Coprinellus micaceus TaxID=71717 RepID=A0A4Y7SI02_COPMI|nr:hypothetical protein FA13DRAFT_1800603 [Coprinellus micaceus]
MFHNMLPLQMHHCESLRLTSLLHILRLGSVLEFNTSEVSQDLESVGQTTHALITVLFAVALWLLLRL